MEKRCNGFLFSCMTSNVIVYVALSWKNAMAKIRMGTKFLEGISIPSEILESTCGILIKHSRLLDLGSFVHPGVLKNRVTNNCTVSSLRRSWQDYRQIDTSVSIDREATMTLVSLRVVVVHSRWLILQTENLSGVFFRYSLRESIRSVFLLQIAMQLRCIRRDYKNLQCGAICYSGNKNSLLFFHFVFLVTLVPVLGYSERTALDSPENIRLYRVLRQWALNFVGKSGEEGGPFLEIARRQKRVQERIPNDTPFPCDVSVGKSPVTPTSVHKLRPGDINVIAAMGDSLTAGFGALASNLFHIFVENRGVSSIGGGQGTWKDFLTLANIIKEFNPKLIGYAISDSFTIHEASQFNVAESGAMSRDTPYMAEILVKRIKNDPRVNMEKDWKLINLMIGPNDFCSDMCWIPSPWSVLKNHKEDLIQVLRTLRDNLPRTLVSIIISPSMKVLTDLTPRPFPCDLTTNFECFCIFGLRWQKQRSEFYYIMEQWQNLEEEVARMSEFQKDDFTVVTQPFTINMSIPVTSNGLTDWTFLSTDCFHISQKGNARAANAVWNNLLERPQEKTRSWDETFKRFLCPTAKRPYIATWKN